MSYGPATVTTMNVGYVFSTVVGHLPVLAVLIAGLVLIGTRRARIGPRAAMFGQLGAGVLLVAEVLQLGWGMAFPSIVSALDYDSSRYQAISIAVSLLLSLLFAAGIGLLVAAVVARAPGSGGPGAGGPGAGGPGFAGPGYGGPGYPGPGAGGPGYGGPGQGFGPAPGPPAQRF
jgi:hypothetical protein